MKWEKGHVIYESYTEAYAVGLILGLAGGFAIGWGLKLLTGC